jgi:uncharacterized membrane protein
MANELMTAAAGPEMPPAGGPGLEPRTVAAGRGASWWSEGWRLFTPGFGMWILAVLILVVVNVGLNLIPVVGPLASQILFPVFTGGLMLGCRAVDRGNPLTLAHAFAGFSQRTGPLVLVGVIYTVLVIAVMVVVAVLLFVFFGAAVIGAIAAAGDPSRLGLTLESMSLALLVGALLFLALYLPVMMAAWFAPALVMLGGAEPLAAMKLSFSGCLKNIVPFLAYGLIGILLAIVASIPLGLGWLVLAPVSIATIYASYCDIFEDKDA